MELKWYLQVLWRRWPAILVLPILVGLFAVYQETTRDEQYAAEARLAVVRQPDQAPVDDYRYDEYYNYLSSEFKIDDLVETVRGNVFAASVAEEMTAAGVPASPGEVQGALSSSREHRILTLTATTQDPDRSLQIARAAIEELEANPALYLDISDSDGSATVRAIQVPEHAAADTTRARLIVLMSVIAAIGIGVVLAFLVDYLDDTLYDADGAASATGLPVLATVPAERSS